MKRKSKGALLPIFPAISIARGYVRTSCPSVCGDSGRAVRTLPPCSQVSLRSGSSLIWFCIPVGRTPSDAGLASTALPRDARLSRTMDSSTAGSGAGGALLELCLFQLCPVPVPHTPGYWLLGFSGFLFFPF